MLKIECPSCHEWLHSQLLLEMEQTKCPSCGGVVPVKDVYVSAGPYSIHRDILLGHLFKYKRLLNEAHNELAALKKEGEGLKSYGISSNTVQLFIDNLREMLEGCRNGFRVEAGDVEVDYVIGGTSGIGKLVNISISGICLDTGRSSLPGKGAQVDITLSEGPHLIAAVGEVVWTSPKGEMGLRFTDLDKETLDTLRQYITAKGEEGR